MINLLQFMLQIKSDYPPTSPSASAALEIHSNDERSKRASNSRRWLCSIKDLAINKQFGLMFFVVGGFLGYNSTLIAKVRQLAF